MYKKIFVGAVFLAIAIVAIMQGFGSTKIVDASGPQITNFNSFASSSSAIVGTGSTLVVATNTARMYLEIANLSSKPIYCALKGGAVNQAASMYRGLTIFASTTRVISTVDIAPYVGPVYCISEAAASTTILEQ